ncbi:hypothetical protein [Methylobrevis pamukkalensis]|uniref:Uncharacterized protein n=1 Tax=Methylobrevis pamukkalensis TaxID=1439726 RepID=A0A1E3GYT5_9HYPH|nr:hypothetical protein [Methylobrevis pamukkalensis]ODN69220.1 hypothetical protein A6302_03482 [Methylobrevis pamukkalensis]
MNGAETTSPRLRARRAYAIAELQMSFPWFSRLQIEAAVDRAIIDVADATPTAR